MRRFLITLLVLVAPLCWGEGNELPSCSETEAAKLISLQGKLLYDVSNQGQWQVAQLNQTLCEGSRVKVEANSRVLLQLPNGIVLRLYEGTVLSLNTIAPKKASLLDLAKGFVHFISRTPKRLQISTPIANAGPEGTEFALRVDDNKAELWVYEGGVKFFNDKGNVHLSPGQGAQAQLGQAPRADIDIKPLDAVAWALYYPPLLPYPDASISVDSEIRQAIMDFRQGHIDVALSRLDSLPTDRQSPYFYKVRAAIRLSVGLDKLALQDIQILLASNPNDAEALALQSVRLLVQNHKDEAYTLAKRAVIANPTSATAYSALSYAEQGRFDLDKALQAADKATKYAPHDAMVWARKAELELMLGQTTASSQSAHQALGLDANLERTQTVTGFAYLLGMDTDEALQSFERAVKLDSSSPLARLGLGLTKIRKGDLAAGRQDLEIAAILDPGNSLIRSYLGKAYYEENRNTLAEDQFNLAKERDPKDPTPYFYDALKKQTENRPVEALQNLQKAIALNDNRAVYRSKQLLDSDRAARGASLARIYDTLGFERRGIVEATSSLQIDPTNFSAHRFLSDSYVSQPGRETAQLSELLQAKMLQPININPVQPHLAVSQRGLLNASGIANSSFQDFTRVFERNRPQLLVSGVAGNQGILGDEATLSGIANKFSYSFGQYHYGNHGVSANDSQNFKKFKESHDIYDAFIQAMLNDHFDVQFEYLNRNTFQGNTNRNTQGILRENVIRTGFHWKPTESQHWLGLYTYKDNFVKQLGSRETTVNNKTNLWEGQYINNNNYLRFLAGFNYYNLNEVSSGLSGSEKNQNGFNVYVYPHVQFCKYLNITLGFSYDQHDPDASLVGYNSKWSPKLGLQWDILNHAKFRLAYMAGYKKPLLVSETLEPTQIAGFNQLFDDFNERSYKFYGAALDFSWPGLFSGFEASHREIFSFDNNKEFVDRYTNILKAYLSFTVNNNVSLNTEYRYEKNFFYADKLTVYAHKIPIELRYFNPVGVYFNIGATYVSQNKFQNEPIGSSKFVVVDTAVGYRLPKRFGIVSLELKNIFDKKFDYDNLSSFNQSNIFNNTLDFFSERTIFGRITFNF